MQILKFYIIDLARIKGSGAFKCPKCGVRISPDDETDNVYAIVETIMNGENLDKITLQCVKCGSQIQLTGFNLLSGIK